MNHSARARRGGRLWRCLALLVLLMSVIVRVGHAQTPPTRPRPDTVPSTPPLTPSDSALRDSIIMSILAQDSARGSRPAAFALFGFDRLRLRTFGASVGVAWPGQALATQVYSLHADYGQIYPGVRLLFMSSYWTTRYRDDEVARLAREIQRRTLPNGADSVHIGKIRVADLSAGAEVRWQPRIARRASALLHVVSPWIGGGLAAHFVNVEGPPISDTFVEHALDAASIGLSTSAGIDVRPLPNVSLSGVARYDFLGSVRYGSVRAGISFIFGPAGAW